MKRLIWIAVLLLSVSCKSLVSTNTGNDIDKAENRIIKYNTGIQNQVKEYPELIENAYTVTEYDTIKFDPDTVIVNIPLQDSAKLDSIKTEYFKASKSFDELSRELSSVKTIDNKEASKLQRISQELNVYKEKSDKLYSMYLEAAALNFKTGTYETDKYIADYKIIKGELQQKIKVKPQYEVVEKTKTTNNLSIRKDYWEDRKFYYTFLIPILLAIYLFGDKLKSIFNGIVKYIVKFVRKLVLKI